MDIKELSQKLKKITDAYVKKNNVNVTRDGSVLKIHEEMGEFTQAYLRFSTLGKNKENKSKDELRSEMNEELADVVSMCLVFALENDIDLEEEITSKWLKYLDEN